jgi:O-antigen ligase
VDVARARPLLGVGPDNFVVALPDFVTPDFSRDWIYTVHDGYLLVLAETGLLGLAAYLLYVGTLLGGGGRALRAGPSPAVGPILLGALAGVVARLVHLPFDIFNGRLQLQSFAMVAAVLAVASSSVLAARRSPRRRSPGLPQPVAMAGRSG